MHIAICGSATRICNAVGLLCSENLITWPFCIRRTLTTELLCLVEAKMPMPSPYGLGCRTTNVQSGPIALELWLYNNPLFTHTAETVKTANRFFDGRQPKHPCRAHAPRWGRNAGKLNQSCDCFPAANFVDMKMVFAIPVIRWVQTSVLLVSPLPRVSPQLELACTWRWEKKNYCKEFC